MTDANEHPKPQVEKFREAARELQTDESEENFDRVLKKVAKASPPSSKPTKKEDEKP